MNILITMLCVAIQNAIRPCVRNGENKRFRWLGRTNITTNARICVEIKYSFIEALRPLCGRFRFFALFPGLGVLGAFGPAADVVSGRCSPFSEIGKAVISPRTFRVSDVRGADVLCSICPECVRADSQVFRGLLCVEPFAGTRIEIIRHGLELFRRFHTLKITCLRFLSILCKYLLTI